MPPSASLPSITNEPVLRRMVQLSSVASAHAGGDQLEVPPGGWSELIDALGRGEYRHLLNTWAPFDIPEDENGLSRSLLYWASAAGQTDLVDALLGAGADPNLGWMWGDSPDRHDVPPLYGAVSHGETATARRLLDAGADPNWGSSGTGVTLLHCAVYQAPSLVGLLIEAGAVVDARTAIGETPMHEALKRTNGEDVMRLLRAAYEKRTAGKPGAVLRAKRAAAKAGGPFSAFASPRLNARVRFAVAAVRGDVESLGALLQGRGVGARWERDCAGRRVLGPPSPVWLLRMRGAEWTWVLFAIQVQRVTNHESVREHVAALSLASGSDAHLFVGPEVTSFSSGKRTDVVSFDAESSPETERSPRRGAGLERKLMAAADAFWSQRGLELPALREDSDGFELILTLQNRKTSDVERLDALVIED